MGSRKWPRHVARNPLRRRRHADSLLARSLVLFRRMGLRRLAASVAAASLAWAWAGMLITRGWAGVPPSVSASSGDVSQVRMLSSRLSARGISNFSPHRLQRAVRPWASTGRRYLAPHLEQEHLIVSATTHLGRSLRAPAAQKASYGRNHARHPELAFQLSAEKEHG